MNLIIIIIILSSFIAIDLILLISFSSFYTTFGIPFYIKSGKIKENKTVKEIIESINPVFYENLKLKKSSNLICFRTKLNLGLFFTAGFLYIIKGKIIFTENSYKVKCFFNNTTFIFLIFFYIIPVFIEIDLIGIIFLIIFSVIIIGLTFLRIRQLNDLIRMIE